MYVGNITIVAGLALASNSLADAAAWRCRWYCFAYIAIVAAEENYLRGKFGAAYDEYCRDVPRWLPRLGALWSTFSGATFHWRRVIVKEYGTPAGWIAALCGVTLYNVWDNGDLEPGPPGVRAVLLVIVVTFGLWLLARAAQENQGSARRIDRPARRRTSRASDV